MRNTGYTISVYVVASLCVLNTLCGQVQGNFKRRANEAPAESAYHQQLSNFNVSQVPANRQYGGLLKSAALAGENVVEFHINALANQRADTYTVIFNAVQLGKTAEETNTALKNRLDPFIADVKAIGVKPEDVYVDMVNFLPKYEFDVFKKLFSKRTYTEIPIGFELQKNVHIRFSNPSTLDQIVETAARHEIYDIIKVDYFIKDQKAVYAQLRQAALNYVGEIKNAYKSLYNLDSAYVITAENTWVAYPGDRYQSYQAFSTQSLDASQRADSKVERADKPVSQFYDAIAANDYDIVLNPDILEPCVQFSYNLIVRYTRRERQVPVKETVRKEFILVTPTGEVKTLKID